MKQDDVFTLIFLVSVTTLPFLIAYVVWAIWDLVNDK